MANNSMQGKTCLITGATNGIGKETALSLAQMGARIVVVGRNRQKSEAVVAEIKQQSGNNAVELLLADLSSQKEVRRLADEVKANYPRLDVLVNNAGGIYTQRQLTVDGLEYTFALNHLSYFLLTNLLLDLLKASTPARIVNVSSGAHQMGKMEFDNLQGEKRYSTMRAYGTSKLENILFTYELARKLEGTGITTTVMHPGGVATGFGHNNAGIFSVVVKFFHLFSRTPAKGAETVVWLASSPDVEGATGKYYYDLKEIKSNAESHDQAKAQKLWQMSQKLTGLA